MYASVVVGSAEIEHGHTNYPDGTKADVETGKAMSLKIKIKFIVTCAISDKVQEAEGK